MLINTYELVFVASTSFTIYYASKECKINIVKRKVMKKGLIVRYFLDLASLLGPVL
jgi:hypothetical protein